VLNNNLLITQWKLAGKFSFFLNLFSENKQFYSFNTSLPSKFKKKTTTKKQYLNGHAAISVFNELTRKCVCEK